MREDARRIHNFSLPKIKPKETPLQELPKPSVAAGNIIHAVTSVEEALTMVH
ncbi:MAG: hypothetical protein ABL857_06450 [Rickettsiales bacterium]|jgi:hypothetical protein